jgi:hypothetical protein
MMNLRIRYQNYVTLGENGDAGEVGWGEGLTS